MINLGKTITLPALLLLLTVMTAAQQDKTVSVLYAGSLGALMEKSIRPGFEKRTGIQFLGEGQGSVAAARMIKDGLRAPDVFVSADAAVNENLLMSGRPLIHWYLSFASGELVMGYNPGSKYKDDFERARTGQAKWYEVLAKPGVKLGRTDPNLDPKGYRTLFLFKLAEGFYHKPELSKLLGPAGNVEQIYPEPELMMRLETGQLDAAVFYRHEALAHGLPFVELPDQINQSNPQFAGLYAEQSFTTNKGVLITSTPIVFTITALKAAKNAPAAVAFISFLLSDQGKKTMRQYGLRAVPISVEGDSAKIPNELSGFIGK